MQNVNVNGVELEYEVFGSGEPVLLISPVLADGFLPLVRQSELADRYQLIHYHRRGWVGSTHPGAPVSIEEHAADASALLDRLGIPRAHVAGHSSGAAVAVQLALDAPQTVQTLILLELSLLALAEGRAFLQGAGPVFAAYERGDHEGAFAMFMSVVSGLDWAACRALLEERIPGAIAQSVADADTFFGIELPSLAQWTFDAEKAAGVRSPVLSVSGSQTLPLWVEVADFLRSTLPRVEDCTIEGVGHLLHIQRPQPVAEAMARFLIRNRFDAGSVYLHAERGDQA
jgi:pimeloyl-ACP methyl ester carboxylesterase